MATCVHPSSVIENGAVLHDGVTIGPFCHIGASAEIGEGSLLMSYASVIGNTRVGRNCTLHPHAVLGGLPQVIGLAAHPDSRLEIDDGCVFREYATAHEEVEEIEEVEEAEEAPWTEQRNPVGGRVGRTLQRRCYSRRPLKHRSLKAF